MNAALVILSIFAQYGPGVAQAAKELLTIKEPSQEDWDRLWALTQVPFDQLVPKKG